MLETMKDENLDEKLNIDQFVELTKQMKNIDDETNKTYFALDINVPDNIQSIYNQVYNYIFRFLEQSFQKDDYVKDIISNSVLHQSLTYEESYIENYMRDSINITGKSICDLVINDRLGGNYKSHNIDVLIDSKLFSLFESTMDADTSTIDSVLGDIFGDSISIQRKYTEKSYDDSQPHSLKFVNEAQLDDFNVNFIIVYGERIIDHFDFFFRSFYFNGKNIYGHQKALNEISNRQITPQKITNPSLSFVRYLIFKDRYGFHMKDAYLFMFINRMIQKVRLKNDNPYIERGNDGAYSKHYKKALKPFFFTFKLYEKKFEPLINDILDRYFEAYSDDNHPLNALIKIYDRTNLNHLFLYECSEKFQFFLDHKLYLFFNQSIEVSNLNFEKENLMANDKLAPQTFDNQKESELLSLLDEYRLKRVFDESVAHFEMFCAFAETSHLDTQSNDRFSSIVDALTFQSVQKNSKEDVYDWLVNSASRRYDILLPMYADTIHIYPYFDDLLSFLIMRDIKFGFYFEDPFDLKERVTKDDRISDWGIDSVLKFILDKNDDLYFARNEKGLFSYMNGRRFERLMAFFHDKLGQNFSGLWVSD